MPPSADILPVLNRLLASHRAGRQLALLFDYDGTLVPLAPHPELATLDRATRRLLEQLARLPRVTIGIISGRSLDDLEGMVGLPHLHYAGVSGLELHLAGKQIRRPRPVPTQAVIGHVVEHLEAVVAGFPGAWIEDKQFGLAVHVRNLDPSLIPTLRTRVLHIVQEVSEPLRIADGPLALEITPDGDCHKGSAVQSILHHLGSHLTECLYAGDEANDLEAFEEIAARGGITIGVGLEAPCSAQFRLATPHELATVLEDLHRGLTV